MKKKQNKKLSLGLLISLFVLLVSGSTLLYTQSSPKYNKNTPIVSQVKDIVTGKKKVIYPRLYSDTNITANAIISDPEYKHLSEFPKVSMLANVFSAQYVKSAYTGILSDAKEKGTWLWTPTLDITPKYRDSIIAAALRKGINVIYLSIDSYLDIYVMGDGPEKIAKKKLFGDTIENFIKKANESGLQVDAEAGWRNWAEKGNSYKAFGILNFIKEYNRTRTYTFRGFQYDVEPYLLENYQEDKAEVLADFLDLVNETTTRLHKTNLLFSVVIPEFYDGTYEETPKFSYAGKTAFAVEHLLSILDRRPGSSIIVMSYRNFSGGDDGSIEITEDEIEAANRHTTKVIVAQETGDFLPPYITFHKTTLKYYGKQQALLRDAFTKEKSFGGTAIHYINAYMELK